MRRGPVSDRAARPRFDLSLPDAQRAFGGFFAPLVAAHNVEWTTGAPAYLQSSNLCRRGFCAECGTPLTYESEGPLDIAIGSLDDPTQAPPAVQVNVASALPFHGGLTSLPPLTEAGQAECDRWNDRVESHQRTGATV